MVKIVWTEVSINDLRNIFDFIAVDSVRYATITVNKIYLRTQAISDNTSIGRIVPELKKKSIREIIDGKFRIIYRITNHSQVDILRVYHSARLLRKKNLL
jgi:toxin ParE1/3/4